MVSTLSPRGEKHVYRKSCHDIVPGASSEWVLFLTESMIFLAVRSRDQEACP